MESLWDTNSNKGENIDNRYLVSKLGSLRNALLIMVLASGFSMIPFLNFIGGILLFVGVIMLILAFGKLSAPSPLSHTKYYKSTEKWIIVSLIVGIIFSIIISAIVLSALSTLYPYISSSNTSNLQNIYAILNGMSYELGIALAIFLSVFIISFWKFITSLKFLSLELNSKRLKTASTILLLSLIVTVMISISMIPLLNYELYTFLSSGTTPSSSIFYTFQYLDYLINFVVNMIPLIGYYYAYSALRDYDFNLPRTTAQ